MSPFSCYSRFYTFSTFLGNKSLEPRSGHLRTFGRHRTLRGGGQKRNYQ